MLKKMLQKIKDNPIKYAIGTIVGLIAFSIIMIATGGNNIDTSRDASFDTGDNRIHFNDLMEDDQNAGDFLFGEEEVIEKPMQTETDRFLDSIRSLHKGKESNILENDNDRLLEELLAQQEENEKRAAEAIKDASKEKELTYSEKLAIERGKHFVIREVKGDEKEKVVFRGYVFRTQYVVPGERVDLMTSEEFIYNNTRFKKGMRFYGVVDIQETRILFDIDNIAHVPLKAEVRDIADGRIGLYSKQAGELWSVYQERLKEETRNNLTREVSNGAKTPILSSTIQVLSNFFASKKGRKTKKLKIDNNSQFIVTLL